MQRTILTGRGLGSGPTRRAVLECYTKSPSLSLRLSSAAHNSSVSSGNSFRGKKLQLFTDLENQAVLHKDGGFRLSSLKDLKLQNCPLDEPQTMYQVLRDSVHRKPEADLLGRRVQDLDGSEPYHWTTYKETMDRSENIAAAILNFGIEPGQNTRIGIFSANRPEWFLTEHATYVYRMINVPVYATFGPDECLFVVKKTKMPLIVCDNEEKAKMLLRNGEELPFLKALVVMDPFDPSLRDIGNNLGIKVLSFAELELMGKESPKPKHSPPKISDVATICFTSGTTGSPKGVMVTHANFSAVMTVFKDSNMKRENRTYLSYMPAAHMFERIAQAELVAGGGRIGFFSGNTQLVLNDMQALKPNIIITVPRVFNKVYHTIYDSIRGSPAKSLLFRAALAYKKMQLDRGIVRTDTWADKLVFHKVQKVFGGNLDCVFVGSAPLHSEVLTFFRCALGCIVREGYGQTESTACGTISQEGDHSVGHVGAPSPCVEVKIIDVPKMSYFADKNGGEILFRGPIVTKGYFDSPEKTEEAFDKDGWLHTGDIGRMDDKGRLVLVDRMKNLIKLPNGEFLVPEKIESVYGQCSFVEQVYVHGESMRNDLVAVLVVNREYLLSFTKEQLGLEEEDLNKLCAKREVRDAIIADLHQLGKEKGLMTYEQVRRVYVTEEPFTIENDLLTPTLKNKRPHIKDRYADVIAWMYEKLDKKAKTNGKII